MKFRKALLGAAAGLGALAATNRVLRAEALDPPLGREQQTYQWRGFDVAYTEAGAPDDPDLLLVHGVNAAGSSHEFHRIVDDLADHYHVIAPDLPGFGHSDRPPLMYSGALYVAFLEDVARDLTAEPTVVASSLSGAYAAVAAESVAFADLVLISPTPTTMPWRRVWLRTLLRSPLVGQALFNLIVSKRSIRRNLAGHGFHDPANITDELVDYDWRAAHLPGARFAPASFVGGFLDLDVDLGETLAGLDEPVTLVWGREAETTPVSTGRELAETADAQLIVFDDADLLPHVEFPSEFADLLVDRRRA
ncbi:MAG: alpha/beta fold hydrolase [Haloarculaceae archaeon]